MSDHSLSVLADQQTKHLKKSLGRFDIVFLVIAAVIAIETLAKTASFGSETFTWTLVLAIFFLVPYGLIFAETGSTFIGEGGAYLWVRQAFGRPLGALASILSWITQPVWVGGSMAFLASAVWDSYLLPTEPGSFADYAFKIGFIWLTVVAAILSLSRAKWIPSLGAILKLLFLAFFLFTTILYAFEHGVSNLELSGFAPTTAGFLGLVPLLLFAYLGFESSNSASGEMKNPQRDIPAAIARSGATAAACYLLPILAILLVLPADTITGIGGLMGAVSTVFSVYGPASEILLVLAAAIFVAALACQGAAWMIISDRMQGLAAADGSFFGGFFGKFHPRLGTPVHVNLLSGVVATVFMLTALQLTGTSAALFGVVLSIAISTFLLSYLLIIPAAIKLRWKYPDVERPFRVRVGNRGFTALGILCFAWILLGSWVAVFPGTLGPLVGLDYNFQEIWGVERVPFQILTLGTLAALVALCLTGYVRGRHIRSQRPDTEASELLEETTS
ncbi:APC family permease [Arthrobacter castelli]|uniref:APC family permease n=1 Tax=Arthrobacter castelli TaxID=271431 RepID=UPI000428E89B|nr:APC family permease [Arthrobacter castelli]